MLILGLLRFKKSFISPLFHFYITLITLFISLETLLLFFHGYLHYNPHFVDFLFYFKFIYFFIFFFFLDKHRSSILFNILLSFTFFTYTLLLGILILKIYFDYNFYLQTFKTLLSKQQELLGIIIPVFKDIWKAIYTIQMLSESIFFFLTCSILVVYSIKTSLFLKHFDLEK